MNEDNRVGNYDYYIRGIGFGLRHRNDQKLASHRITNQQARLLGEIMDIQNARQEISRKSLSDLMQLSGPSVTSLLNGLQKNGFIIRRAGDDDGRTTQIELTEKAKELVVEMQSVFDETEKQLFTGFTDEQKNTFLELLKMAYENIK
jgi:DNA-binding MarR family transcriptional regulator